MCIVYYTPLFLKMCFVLFFVLSRHVSIVKPLLVDSGNRPRTSSRDVPLGDSDDKANAFFARAFASNPEFYRHAAKFFVCFCGLQASYLTWGYMQELIMTTQFTPTPRVPSGKFPSAAFCVFSNRFLAVIVAAVAVRVKHGSVFHNNAAPLWAFTPCALSNTMSSWSQYASLKYVSFPVQTVFKSSKLVPVMLMVGSRIPFRDCACLLCWHSLSCIE